MECKSTHEAPCLLARWAPRTETVVVMVKGIEVMVIVILVRVIRVLFFVVGHLQCIASQTRKK